VARRGPDRHLSLLRRPAQKPITPEKSDPAAAVCGLQPRIRHSCVGPGIAVVVVLQVTLDASGSISDVRRTAI
jgi:hypothetical protein